jgi:hypothetical protein
MGQNHERGVVDKVVEMVDKGAGLPHSRNKKEDAEGKNMLPKKCS